jgi:uncharacterized protein involved in response to NO
VGLLFAGNLVFHIEAFWNLPAASGVGMRLGLAATLFLIMLIGGRIIPSFTRNWLKQRNPGRLPAAFDRFDLIALFAGGSALALWAVFPGNAAAGYACLLAGVLHLARLCRWSGHRTVREPLLLILHVGYAFVVIGFLLAGGAILAPEFISSTGALHSWTAGAVGIMTLAVMARATRGHTGRLLTAPPSTQAIFGALLLSVGLRISAPYLPIDYLGAITVSAVAWTAAFIGYSILYAPMLTKPGR